MANPTSQVFSLVLPFGGDDTFYFPYPTGVADLFVTGEMVALNPATGFAVHCDQTIANEFRGLYTGPDFRIATDNPAPVLIQVRRPRLFTMKLTSGTLARGATALNAPVYAVFSGTVQLSVTGLTVANKVGYYWDIANANPETNTGATWIWISPSPIA